MTGRGNKYKEKMTATLPGGYCSEGLAAWVRAEAAEFESGGVFNFIRSALENLKRLKEEQSDFDVDENFEQS